MEEILQNAAIIPILQIIAIDIVLGGDNAIVIALACKNLPENQRKLGIFYGAIGAIVLRVIMVFFASTLLLISGLKIIGGILLLWIGIKLILDNKKESSLNVSQENSLFGAIKTIIIADFVMSLDNSVAIAGAADGNIYLVIFGLLLSVPIIIWGSSIILKLIDKYPIIIYLGAALLGWISGDMIQTDILTTQLP
jgi:integral membrane protein, YjbE family